MCHPACSGSGGGVTEGKRVFLTSSLSASVTCIVSVFLGFIVMNISYIIIGKTKRNSYYFLLKTKIALISNGPIKL